MSRALAAQAYQVAQRRLRELHGEDLARLLVEERVSRGLTPTKMPQKPSLPAKPCRNCGGQKPEGIGSGAFYCGERCRQVAAERKRERAAARRRELRSLVPMLPCRRCGGEKTRGSNSSYCAGCRDKPRDRSRARTVAVKTKKPKVTYRKPPVPSEIRDQWRKAKPGSIMRKKFPSTKALERHDWSGWVSPSRPREEVAA